MAMSIFAALIDFSLGNYYDLRGIIGEIIFITNIYVLPILWTVIAGYLLKLQFNVGLRRWTLLTTLGVVALYILYRPIMSIEPALADTFSQLPIFNWLQMSLLLLLGITQAIAIQPRFRFWWLWSIVPLLGFILVNNLIDPFFFITRFSDGQWIPPYGAAIGVVFGLFSGSVLWALNITNASNNDGIADT